MTDYAFINSLENYEKFRWGGYYQSRPSTTVLFQSTTKTVAAFLKHLENTGSVTKPVGDLLLVSHGDQRGRLALTLFKGAGLIATYETIEKAKANSLVTVPAALVATPTSTDVYIESCRTGQSLETMTLLKQTFGTNIRKLIASYHLSATGQVSGRVNGRWRRVGFIQYLLYDWSVKSKTEITKRADLVTAFKTANHKDIDNLIIPDSFWEKWIPKQINKPWQPLQVAVKVNPKIGNEDEINLTPTKKERGGPSFKHSVLRRNHYFPNLTSEPANKLQFLKNSLSARTHYKPTHSYPVYERYGYSSVNEYVDAFSWKISYWKRAKKLACHGSMHIYEFWFPVVVPQTYQPEIFYNFYPASGIAFNPVENLPVTDNRLFRAV